MSDKLFHKLSQIYNYDKLPWIIIGIGIALRIVRYLHNPSLWFDESVLALDIINRPFSNFIIPSSDYDHGFPLGFPILTKIPIQIFSYSEYTLRLFPLLFGIISLFLFYRISKHYIRPKAVPAALFLFAISDPLVLFSSELKPYSCDITIALSVYALTIYVQSKKLNVLHIALYAILGAFFIWFSNPSVFILAGVGACLVLSCVCKKEWSKLGMFSIAFLIWALSFIVYYIIFVRSSYANISMGTEELLRLEFAFMPVPPKSLSDIKWFIDNFFGIFDFPLGFSLTGITGFAFLIGCVSLFRENKEKFFILISPVLLTLLASALHKYPFKGRLILFLVPLMLLFIAEGVKQIHDKTKNHSAIIGAVFIGILFIYPLSWAAYHAKNPISRADIKPVLSHIKDNWRDGDIVYVFYYSQYAFEYYAKYHPGPYSFDENEYTIGIAPRGWYDRWRKQSVSKYYDLEKEIVQSHSDVFKEYVKDINKLKGHKRIWALFTEGHPRDGIEEDKFFKYHFEQVGKLRDSFGRSGLAIAYLYDVSEQKEEIGRE
jgi:hypothetical protein